MKKWCVVFESDAEFLESGTIINAIETPIELIPVQNGVLREFPTRAPQIDYDFETFKTGFAKGHNWVIDDLDGITHGEYDPMGLKTKGDQNVST